MCRNSIPWTAHVNISWIKVFLCFGVFFFFFYSRQLLVCLTTFVVAQAIQVLGQWESRMVAVTRGPNVVAYINNLLAQVLWAVDS